jgi:hypothetical protein
MRGKASALAAATIVLLATGPSLAVNDGLFDGSIHPAVGFLIGSQDASGCNGQAVGCSGVLIAPDVLITSAQCAADFNEALATPGFITHAWVTFDPDDPFDCSQFVELGSPGDDGIPFTGDPHEVTPFIANPAFDPARGGSGNVGVARLAAPVSVPPAELPPAADLFSLDRAQLYNVVAYGFDTHENVLSTTRRFAAARSLGFTSELLALTFKLGGQTVACIDALNEGGAAFVGSTNKVEALVIDKKGGCSASSTYQRLDVDSVRAFLAPYVTLP